MNYKVRLSTKTPMGVKQSDTSIYHILDALEAETERVQNLWIENDDEYLPWGGYPFKVTKIKFDTKGDVISLELTETK